ncbi:MAG TPA: hypothetical protein VGS80_19545, partial [Ktedonobacterales bacterium]|nr:hypothetical protein [Ktedonobacterales bacterium]
MGDIDTVGTLGSMGIVGSSAARGAATVGTLQAVLTGVVLLLLVASVLAYVWRAPMARGWRARLRRSGGWWRWRERRSGRWRRVGWRVGRQMGGAIARHVGRVPPLRSALDAEALLRRLLSPAEYRGLRRK